ncbi:metalloproteinase inhibitor 1-like [Ahaetulla prasina]|uniref:metalloproteinase inhibitor 1-like n=1 Tax=Ahaetulla prasina TaxID=499056 RepID=UPI0026495DB9|nr:metalloproteinase inhibitor 1-like [Ahaetulla prasina]
MDTTKSHGFFLASFLVLMFLGDLIEGCRCKRISLHETCCTHDFVMRTKFMGVRPDPASPSYMTMNMFSIQPIQVFKGPTSLRNAQVLYSPESQSYCGYLHRGRFTGEEYLISGSIYSNRPEIKLCSFAEPWDIVTSEQKKILKEGGCTSCSVS